MQHISRFRGAVIAMALVLATSACGSGDGSEESTEAEVTADSEADGSSADDTTGATTDSTESARTATGDSGSEWCDRLRQIQDEGGPSPVSFNFLNMSPAEIELQFKTNLATFEDWAEVAPPEIDGDIDTFIAAFGEMVEAGDNAGWRLDAIAADPAFGASLDDPEVAAAGDRIDAYSRDVCGVDIRDLQAPAQPATGAGEGIARSIIPIPPGLVSDDVLQCMNDELAPLYPDPLPPGFTPNVEDIANFEAAAATCGFSFG